MADKRTRIIKNPPLPRPQKAVEAERLDRPKLREDIATIIWQYDRHHPCAYPDKRYYDQADQILDLIPDEKGFDEGIKKATDASTFTKQLEELFRELDIIVRVDLGEIPGLKALKHKYCGKPSGKGG